MTSKRKKPQPPRVPVPASVRARLLLWCDRHCCFCGKSCGVDIELHHIDGDRTNADPDNLTPVCYDCHAKLPRYDADHPRGTRYRDTEVRTRREQVYEQHTRCYIEPVEIAFKRSVHVGFSEVGSLVRHMGSTHPVQLQLQILAYNGGTQLNLFPEPDLYNGGLLWNFNPGQGMTGHFDLRVAEAEWSDEVRLECFWAIIDALARPHVRLPFSYVWSNRGGDFWFDPLTKLTEKRDVRPELRPHYMS